MTYSINKSGVYAIQQWIAANQDRNYEVCNLWANGIASEIDRCASLHDDLTRMGGFTYELGLRDAQGHIMTISLDLEHFEQQEEAQS